MKDSNNIIRFLLTFFLGFIGSLIINHSGLKPEKHTSRTGSYFFIGILTAGIYIWVAAICNLFFDDDKKTRLIGYKADNVAKVEG